MNITVFVPRGEDLNLTLEWRDANGNKREFKLMAGTDYDGERMCLSVEGSVVAQMDTADAAPRTFEGEVGALLARVARETGEAAARWGWTDG